VFAKVSEDHIPSIFRVSLIHILTGLKSHITLCMLLTKYLVETFAVINEFMWWFRKSVKETSSVIFKQSNKSLVVSK
jgi:hypothetical protein